MKFLFGFSSVGLYDEQQVASLLEHVKRAYEIKQEKDVTQIRVMEAIKEIWRARNEVNEISGSYNSIDPLRIICEDMIQFSADLEKKLDESPTNNEPVRDGETK